MPVLWQTTELSTADASGNYQDDLSAGVVNIVGFALNIFATGSTPEVVTVTSVAATLWRYRKAHELTGPTIARRVQVGGALDTGITGNNVNITIPAALMELDQQYQLRIAATDNTGSIWVRTREYRAVAG